VLIVVGVSGELGIGVRIAYIDGRIRAKSIELRSKNADLRSQSDQMLALVTQEAGDAADSAKTARTEAEGGKTASKDAQDIATAAKTSAAEAQREIASVSKQAGDIDDKLKLALSMLSMRSVRDPKKMKESVTKYAPWVQPVVVKSYIGDWEGFWACVSVVQGLSTPQIPGSLKVSGAGCGNEPMPSGELPINGIEIHARSPILFPVLLEEGRLLEILRADGGVGNFSDIGGNANPDAPKDHIEVLIGIDPAFSLERFQQEQERLKRQTNSK